MLDYSMEVKSGGITTSVIVKFSGEKDLKKITRLDFYSKSMKIKRIENLEECENLQELKLSYNYISKIENLSSLICLRVLDLSENSIKKLENINTLHLLEHLNLSGNLIKEIESGNLKGLVSLTYINLSKNKISRISEFGNLEALPTIEHIVTNGNLVKQADLKDYLPAKIQTLKYIDGEAVSHNPSINASQWVIKDNLKDFKIQLSEKSKHLNNLLQESSKVQQDLQNIEKSAPDKKYMKDLLEKAEVLNSTSVNLQVTMAQNRELLDQVNINIEKIRKNAKDSGNFIVEEIHALDEAKKLKDCIEELEAQYTIVIEELEKIASEITRIDSLINSTPKFKNTEIKALESKAKDLNIKISEVQSDIQNIRTKIDECNSLVGFSNENKEIDSVLGNIWAKLTDQVWFEESDDMNQEYKRWGNKICEIIDKERSDFLKISGKQNEEIKRLESQVQFLNGKLKKDAIGHCEQTEGVEQWKEKVGVLEKENERLKKDCEKKENFKEAEGKNQENLALGMLAQAFGVSKEWKTVFVEIEKFKSSLEEYQQKCKRFKEKKSKLVESYQEKNLEISEKIAKINIDKQMIKKKKEEICKEKEEVLKEKDELLAEKQRVSEMHKEIKELAGETKENQALITELSQKRNSLEADSIKLEYKIKNLQEECQVYIEKRYKLLEDLKRLQNLCDLENDKFQEARKKLKDSSTSLQKHQEILQEVEKSKDLTFSEQFRITEDIKSKENLLYYLENKLKESEIQLKSELESQSRILKQRQSEILDLDREHQIKQQSLSFLIQKISENSQKLENLNEKLKNSQETYEDFRIKAMNTEGIISNSDLIQRQLSDNIKSKESRLSTLTQNLKEKEENLYQVKNLLLKKKNKLKILNEKIDQAEFVLESSGQPIKTKESEKNSQRFSIGYLETRNSERGFGRKSVETDRMYASVPRNANLDKAEMVKSRILKEISEISKSFAEKEAEFAEKMKKNEIQIEYSQKNLAYLKDKIETAAEVLAKHEKQVEKTLQEINELEVKKKRLISFCEQFNAGLQNNSEWMFMTNSGNPFSQ